MAFLVSPGVEVKETDLTDIVPAVSASVGGFAGFFRWGPSGVPVTIGSEKELARVFGAPPGRSSLSKLPKTVTTTAVVATTAGNDFITVSNAVATDIELDMIVTGPGTPLTTGRPATLNHSTDRFTLQGHGLEDDQIVFFTEAPEGSNLVLNRNYYVREADSGTFKISLYPSTEPNATKAASRVEFEVSGDAQVHYEVRVLTQEPNQSNPLRTDIILTRPTGAITQGSSITFQEELSNEEALTDGEFERSFFTAASFLKYGNSLKVSKANRNGAKTAICGLPSLGAESPYIINSPDDILGDLLGDLQDAEVRVTARHSGSIGNGLKVLFIRGTTVQTAKDEYGVSLRYEPGSTQWALNLRALGSNAESNDEVAVVVIDTSGNFSGKAGTVLEQFEGLSLISNAKNEYGESNYWVDHVNSNSSYICGVRNSEDMILSYGWATVDPTYSSLFDNIDVEEGGYTATLQGGRDGTADASSLNAALGVLEEGGAVDVSLLFAHSFLNQEAQQSVDQKIQEIVEARKDSIGFISAPLSIASMTGNNTKKQALISKFSTIGSSSYLVFDSTPGYVYNKYSDTYLWIPLSGHMAGLCARTDAQSDPWFSPAGLNRGGLLGITKIAYNPSQAERDEIYQKRINPIVSFPGQGVVLYGDRTALTKPSAFDRINVRRLFITLQKAISSAAKFNLFEFNDEFTRSSFRNAIEPYLRSVQGRRGITDFRVVCDASNNTGEVIDSGRFVADIYVKPGRSINYITLNFVATRTGVAFEELVGQ